MLYGELIGTKTDLVGEIDKDVVLTQSKAVEPSTENIVVVPDSGYYLSQVKVGAVTSDIDPNIKADNIRLGTSILGVEGKLAPDKPDQEKSVIPSKQEQEVVADLGYELTKVIVKPTPLEELSVSEDGTYEPSGDNVGFSKVVVSVGGDLVSTIDLPQELQGFSAGSNKQLYTFDLEDGTYLVSDSYSKTTWKLNTATKEWTKLIDNGYSYSFFAKIDDKVIISYSGGGAIPIFAYDIKQSTIEQMTAPNGTLLNTSINGVYDVGNVVLCYNASNGKQIYVYDKTLKRFIVVQSIQYNASAPSYKFENKTLIVTRNTSGTNHLYIFNDIDNSFTLVTGNESLSRQLQFQNAKNNIVTLGFSSSSYLGFYWLDLNTAQVYHAENEAVDTIWVDQSAVLDNGVVLLGRSGTNGVYAYDTNTKTYIAESSDSSLGNSKMANPENIIELKDYALYSRSSGSGGLWQYDKVNNSFSQLSTTAYAYVLLVMILQDNRALIGRKGFGFIYSFNNGTLSAGLYGAGSSITYEIVTNNENEVVLNDTTLNVQIRYDVTTDSITPIGVIL